MGIKGDVHQEVAGFKAALRFPASAVKDMKTMKAQYPEHIDKHKDNKQVPHIQNRLRSRFGAFGENIRSQSSFLRGGTG